MDNQDRDILQNVGQEMKVNPPKQLGITKRKFGAGVARKQKVAILLSKARTAGASIPKAPSTRRSQ